MSKTALADHIIALADSSPAETVRIRILKSRYPTGTINMIEFPRREGKVVLQVNRLDNRLYDHEINYLRNWCLTNLSGNVHLTYDWWIFDHPEDAFAFKMRWYGALVDGLYE